MENRKLARRDFLRASALVTAGVLAAACQPKVVEVTKIVEKEVPKEIEKIVKETVIVAGTPQIVEKVVKETVVVTQKMQIQLLRELEVIKPEEPVAILAQRFQEANPHIEIKTLTTAAGDDYFTKLVTMTAAGTPPDIFYMPPWNLDVFEKENLLADLGPLIEAWKFDLNDIPKALLEEYSLKGVLYGLPVFGHTVYMIAYNKDIFDRVGVPYPPRYWTWDDFLETAKKVTVDENRDGEPEIWGTDIDIIGPARLLPYLWSWGADFYNYPELNKCTLNSPQAVEAIQWALDLIRVHKVAPPPEMGAADLGITFPGGKVAMSWVGSGSWVDPKDPTKFAWGFKWGLTDPPKKVETRSLIHSTGMSIARTSKYRDAAWQFLQFLMSPESQIFYSQRAGKISALISVGAKYAFANLPAEDLQVVNDVIGYAWSRVHWRTPIWHKSASGTQVPEMQKAWLGEQTVKEALDRTCEQVDKMFAELQQQK